MGGVILSLYYLIYLLPIYPNSDNKLGILINILINKFATYIIQINIIHHNIHEYESIRKLSMGMCVHTYGSGNIQYKKTNRFIIDI